MTAMVCVGGDKSGDRGWRGAVSQEKCQTGGNTGLLQRGNTPDKVRSTPISQCRAKVSLFLIIKLMCIILIIFT